MTGGRMYTKYRVLHMGSERSNMIAGTQKEPSRM